MARSPARILYSPHRAAPRAMLAPHRRRRLPMRIDTHGQQIEVTPALRDYVETKLARLGRHFDQPMDVRTLLTLDKPDHRAEATITLAGRTLHADANAIDMYAAIDLLADKLDRLLVKHKEKLVDHHRGESAARDGNFT
jgi:putative sigma-54 modulation protein